MTQKDLKDVGFFLDTTKPDFLFDIKSTTNPEQVLITNRFRKLFVSDKFAEMGFVLNSRHCYGLGQRNQQLELTRGYYTLHSRSRPEGLKTDFGLGDAASNLIMPYLMCLQPDGNYFGMLFVSGGPQAFELVVLDGSDDRQVLNYIALDGNIEIYAIVDSSIASLQYQLQNLVGRSSAPPFYAMGVFHGSNAYTTLA